MPILFPSSVYKKDGGRFKLGTLEGYPVEGDVSALFGTSTIKEHEKGHNGTDIAAPEGTYIYAPCDMTITDLFSLEVESTEQLYKDIKKWFGNSVWGLFTDERGNNWRTMFAHLAEPPHSLKEGDDVKEGDFLGYVGDTGLSTGSHLHWVLGPAENRWLGRNNGNVEVLDYCATIIKTPARTRPRVNAKNGAAPLEDALTPIEDALENVRASSYAIKDALHEAREAIDRALDLVE